MHFDLNPRVAQGKPIANCGFRSAMEETWMNLTKGRGGNWAFRGDLRAVVEDLSLFSLVVDLANFHIGKSTIWDYLRI